MLTLVLLFNFIDRNILSILAEEIKADLGLSDARIGFLYGTACAVFFAVFGIPLGRLADVWVRKSLIAGGLIFWSAMTALSGTARGFTSLGAYRVGVGVGEASLNPAAYSLLSDYFPPSRRATALSLYAGGLYLGGGLGFFLGGWILDSWQAAYPAGDAPLGLRGWQVAFFAVGIPGLLMALWARTLREPRRGAGEGYVPRPVESRPWRRLAREVAAVLPPFHLASMRRAGAGRREIVSNLRAALGICLAAFVLWRLLGEPAQWFALALGAYAGVSWAQGLALRDPPAFAVVIRSKALRFTVLGFATISFVTNGIAFWSAPFFLRVHGVSPTQVGIVLGLEAAVGGWLGVTLGGLLSDKLAKHSATSRVDVGLLNVVVGTPPLVLMLTAESLRAAYVFFFLAVLGMSLWIGPAAAAVNDLVLPRMRGTATAYYFLLITLLGLSLGPFTMGRLSDALQAAGSSEADALRYGILLAVLAWVPACLFLLLAGATSPPRPRVCSSERGLREKPWR